MKKTVLIMMLGILVLSGCNTMRGMVNGLGKDTQKAGEWMQQKVPSN